MRDDIDAFLRLWAEPTEAELRLWEAILAPLGPIVPRVLIEWVRQSECKPHPRQLVIWAKARNFAPTREELAEAAAVGNMREIAVAAAQAKGLTLAELRGPDRSRDLVAARRVVIQELKAAGFAITRIATFLCRDHTSVYHALGRSAA